MTDLDREPGCYHAVVDTQHKLPARPMLLWWGTVSVLEPDGRWRQRMGWAFDRHGRRKLRHNHIIVSVGERVSGPRLALRSLVDERQASNPRAPPPGYDEAVTRRAKGWSYLAIGRAVGRTPDTVSYQLRKMARRAALLAARSGAEP